MYLRKTATSGWPGGEKGGALGCILRYPSIPPPPQNQNNTQDWVKLTTSATDLAGLRRLGGLRGYRLEEVAQHKSPHDAWAVFMGKVRGVVCVYTVHGLECLWDRGREPVGGIRRLGSPIGLARHGVASF